MKNGKADDNFKNLPDPRFTKETDLRGFRLLPFLKGDGGGF
jgi:hypothetical protein